VPGVLGAVLVAALVTAVLVAVRLTGSDDPELSTVKDLAGQAAVDSNIATSPEPTPLADSLSTVRRAALEQERIRQEKLEKKRKAEALAKKAALAAKKAAKEAEEAKNAPFDVRIGSFNVLGSQHTAPGGDRQNFPPASTRSANAAGVIASHGVKILGTQELQNDQLAALQSRTGFAAYPGLAWGSAETDNSILYDDGLFEYVSGSSFTIPFMGLPRPQPFLKLRVRATGREFYVVNTHPSAHDGRYLVERRQGQAALVNVVNGLKDTGLAVLVTGDMNDREEFYCNVVPQAGLVASNGGSYSGGCHPPPSPIAVDWVVGGNGVSFSDYWRDTSTETRKISDHFFISATAHVG
jgi:hypothetical protein